MHYRYNAEGDLIEVLNAQETVVRAFTYHNHLMTSHRNASGLESYYEYDVYGPKGKVLRNTTNLDESWQFEYGGDSIAAIAQFFSSLPLACEFVVSPSRVLLCS